ncbi:DNA cytosine methyltransferase [Paenibacillus sp. 3LSP]|uniref:DNA cytosine methyltransferase n=1 Tax=Paenibacillus sp. 3LSP TaxID=2800795 RepID=UPI0028FD8F99|nr:DNA cytosine methyltransferase [Paenibacillus sp. 3LSP]MDU0329245.1 DNA cytosine methyltransferase [Paenibacillus sp. 3LSP]
MREIIVDNFAGGGGASTGIEMAIGRSVDIAINHDPAAIAMHRANHPETEHYCESVWDVDPREVTRGKPVGLAWFSPDCKHFSKAKGGKPVEKKIRGLAWIVLKWAGKVRPRVIILENVEEFKTWGPVRKGRPVKSKKGQTYEQWKSQLESLGYVVESRELRACDYGAPTIRKRLFIVARCDGRPIVWPEPTHGDPESDEVKSGKLKPWRTAAEIIDWSIPCPSIFERKKPLAENTLRRIARGLQRFVIDNPRPYLAPYVIKVNHQGEQFRGQRTDEPLQTVTAKNGWGVVTPYIARIGQTGFGRDRLQYEINNPLTTVTTKVEHLLVMPHITKFRGGATGHELSEPLHTVTSGAGASRPAGAAHALGMVAAFLTQYHSYDDSARGQTMKRPLLTQDTSNRYGLVTSHLVKLRGTCQHGQPVTEPMPTITAGGMHVGEVRAFLLKYYGTTDNGQHLDEPLHTITTKDRFGLVTIEGVDYQIVDIGMRMLEPHELFAAQGFPPNYIIDVDADGVRYPKSAQVARCGNAVPPPFAEALVRANLPELCTGSGRQLTFERYKPAAGQLEFSL